MCELMAATGPEELELNAYLGEFLSHSVRHPNGWGVAVFYGNAVSMEKEPIPAYKSGYLRERLRYRVAAKDMMAHIRLATKGAMAYENCHPFVKRDCTGRAWTLIHNGTIFHSPLLDGYMEMEEGMTDSERILCHIITSINRAVREKGDTLTAEERCAVMDRVVLEITPCNKVNLIVYDSELFYVHTNYKSSLFMKSVRSNRLFATVPLDHSDWQPVPFMQLLAFREGRLVFEGTKHNNEYIENPDDLKFIYLDYAGL